MIVNRIDCDIFSRGETIVFTDSVECLITPKSKYTGREKEGSYVRGWMEANFIGVIEQMPGDTIRMGRERYVIPTIILNDLGELVSDYKKTHLFNAYKWKESMNTLKGDCLFTPIKTPVGVIGLGICYDLRFPELARYEALSGTQVMLYPAAWVKGEGKFMQWETLLRARAIENEMYVLGCCHYSKEHYMGRSTGFAPDGTRLYLGEEKEELLYAQIDKEQIQNIRTANPVFENRRKDLYD